MAQIRASLLIWSNDDPLDRTGGLGWGEGKWRNASACSSRGWVRASMLGLLKAREAFAHERVAVLREEAGRAAVALETGEIELDRRVIAREEFVDALAASAIETTAATEASGWLPQAASGAFSVGRQLVAAPVGGSSV